MGQKFMKEFLIITGPQGSGNHLFSKIFALDNKVFAWEDLLNEYWIHHFKEPFADCWNNPKLLKEFDWSKKDFYVSSISCPYAKQDNLMQPVIPNYKDFIETLEGLGIKVKLAIIGRDKNILTSQQQRVRRRVSLPEFESQLDYLTSRANIFLSSELLYLYKEYYIKNIGELLNFPVDHQHELINVILKDDQNKKYIKDIEPQALDRYIQSAAIQFKPKK
jgi:hypothetical protein